MKLTPGNAGMNPAAGKFAAAMPVVVGLTLVCTKSSLAHRRPESAAPGSSS
jgi:hypothetical protein